MIRPLLAGLALAASFAAHAQQTIDTCFACHGENGVSGIENAPRLARQREDYLRKALLDFKTGVRVGYGEPVMPAVAAALSEPEIADLAYYLAHFRPLP